MKFMEMKMVLRCEVKHFAFARGHARVMRASRAIASDAYDDNDFPLAHKDFEAISC
jgi:uncharacterized protein YozE (UPF0346 family)